VSVGSKIKTGAGAAARVPANCQPRAGRHSAGNNQTIVWPASASLAGAVSDDGKPNPPAAIAVSWSQVSGSGTVAFGNLNAFATTAGFSVAGNYRLRLVADDGQVASSSDVWSRSLRNQ